MNLIAKIYPTESYEVHDAVFNDLKDKLQRNSENKEKKVGLVEGLTDKKYRKASWLCIFLAISN